MLDWSPIWRAKINTQQLKRRPVIRAANVPGSGVGMKRYDLYFNAYRQLKKARTSGFYIECIAISSSIIEDRLEARRACLNPTDVEKHRFDTLGNLARKLPNEEKPNNKEIIELYKKILDWSEKRNNAIHQVVKYGAKRHKAVWKVRYTTLEKTLDRGLKLADKIDKMVQRLNDADYKERMEKQSVTAAVPLIATY